METKTRARPELDELTLKRREKLLGRTAITGEQRLRNNDPLAPVILLLQEGDKPETVARISEEFEGDMSERGLEQPFYGKVDWFFNGSDFVTDDGLSWDQMHQDGLIAAYEDFLMNPDYEYQLARSEVQAKHGELIRQWYYSDDPNCVKLSSLCPPNTEIPEPTAKLSNFKTDRNMASIWLFEKIPGGIRMHAFSLDHFSLDDLQANNQELGIDTAVAGTTIEQLSRLDRLPAEDAAGLVEQIRATHDIRLDQREGGVHYFGTRKNSAKTEAYEVVAAKPVVKELYLSAVREVAQSLVSETTTPGLAEHIKNLRLPYDEIEMPDELRINWDRPLTIKQARGFMDYLRRRALPHYIYNQTAKHEESESYADGFVGYSDIASAGADAVRGGFVYESACPGSLDITLSQTSDIASALNIYKGKRKGKAPNRNEWEWKKGYCVVDNCEVKNKFVRVGPCNVCEKCQVIFDSENNQPGFLETIIGGATASPQEQRAKVAKEENEKQRQLKTALPQAA